MRLSFAALASTKLPSTDRSLPCTSPTSTPLDLVLDQLQIRQCHFHQPTVDRVEFSAGTQGIAQLCRRGTQALIRRRPEPPDRFLRPLKPATYGAHSRPIDPKPGWTT